MPDIDRTKFALAVAAALRKRGDPGPREAARRWRLPATMWSHIRFARPISAANMLAVCHHLELDPLEFLDLKADNTFAGGTMFPPEARP